MTKHGGEAVMRIGAIGKRPETLRSIAIRPEPPVKGETVDFSGTLEKKRAQFVAALIEMEKVLRTTNSQLLFGHPGADPALRGRMRLVGNTLQQLASRTPRK